MIPFLNAARDAWDGGDPWPANWIVCPEVRPPFMAAYRLTFTLEQTRQVRVFVSADERYELFVDGLPVGVGPELPDADHWYFDTHLLVLDAGAHTLALRHWALGERAAFAQLSVCPGVLLAAEDPALWDVLNTGRAPWRCQRLDGLNFRSPRSNFGLDHPLLLDGRLYDWEFAHERPEREWLAPVLLHPGYNAINRNHLWPREHRLAPGPGIRLMDALRQTGRVRHVAALETSPEAAVNEAALTSRLPIRAAEHLAAEVEGWQQLLSAGRPLTLPPRTARRVLIDLDDYYTGRAEWVVSGGRHSLIRLHWQEALFNAIGDWDKGQRDEIEGKVFTSIWWGEDGYGDALIADGGARRAFTSLGWRAGRYWEVVVVTGPEALTLERLSLREQRYPLEMESTFASSDARLDQIRPIMLRALQANAQEVFSDGPFYEQLMYIGDFRINALVSYALTRDDRLVRRCLAVFPTTRQPDGLTASRGPCRQRQRIPTYSLLWVDALHDYFMWRDDPGFVRGLLPHARPVIDAFLALRDVESGLCRSPEGWNFVDWVPDWPNGVPAGGEPGAISPLVNWQVVITLGHLAGLEQALGEPELAARARRLSRDLASALSARTWVEARGLFSDDLAQSRFSLHAQTLALLSGHVSETQRARLAQTFVNAPGLTATTIYFTHYLFEAYAQLGRTDAILERLGQWFAMPAQGFKASYEHGSPAQTRSDCHGWSAHPLYHYFASILGIRPAAPGFAAVRVQPQLGPLAHAEGRLVHPRGEIVVRADGQSVSVSVPEGVVVAG
jgi:hypothetical protein